MGTAQFPYLDEFRKDDSELLKRLFGTSLKLPDKFLDSFEDFLEDLFLNSIPQENVLNQLYLREDSKGELQIPEFIYQINQADSFTGPNHHLELVLNNGFTKEIVVFPVESTLFGAAIINGKPQRFQETEFYKNAFLNLDKLYEQGRLYNCLLQGEHIKESPQDNQLLF